MAFVFVVVFVVVQFDVDVVVNVENVVAVCRFCCYLSCSRLAGNAANVFSRQNFDTDIVWHNCGYIGDHQ